ncbi:1550_t:CDS:2 [Paraglomus occultum]|uniref:1550_t:CDS:1 n=1 Tax=Paraglomus occultum TaxID=144539 RepID=A0A9N9CRI6_9GLOM|nr:1550_t:CDS:2 [Paraglomus occultum]
MHVDWLAESDLERESKKVEADLENLSDADIERCIQRMFKSFNSVLLKHSKALENLVLSKMPTAPEKSCYKTEEEYREALIVYKKDCETFKQIVSGVSAFMRRLDELFDDIVVFFNDLRTWFKAKISDISAKVRSFINTIAEKLSRLYSEFVLRKAIKIHG